MRVAMVGPFGLKPKGTMAVRALPLAKALKARGHQVALFLPPWSHPTDAGRVQDEEGVRVDNVAISPRVMIPFRLWSHVRAFQPDVVHIFKPKGYAGLVQWLVWQLRRMGLTRTRIVLDTDDWEGAGGWNDVEPYPWMYKKVFAWQELWGLKHADALTVASRALETIVWSLGIPPQRVHYLPNGINPLPPSRETRETIRSRFALGESPVVLLYTRFFEFQIERLVEILAHLFACTPQAKLLVVGKGLFGEEQKFAAWVAERDWQARVHLAGWVEPSQLRGFFAASDAAIYPYEDTLVNRCKCAVKLIDLLAAGVPVVAEDVGQNREYIRHGVSGLLVPPGEAQIFAAETSALLCNPERRARMGQCAAAWLAREYDWGILARRAEKAYMQATQG